MRRHGLRIAAAGAALGLAMAVALAVAPASAAKPGGGEASVTATYSCATFEGLVLTTPTVAYNSVGLRAGETITARVSPASAGDQISLSAAMGLSFGFSAAPATGGLAYTAPVSTVYSLSWRLLSAGTAPSSVTWTFDCSSASGGGGGAVPIADSDRDGVADTADACAATTLPDSFSKRVADRYYATSTGQFVDGAGKAAGVTVVDAGGCSAVQIAKGLRLSTQDSRSGITLTQLQSWASSH